MIRLDTKPGERVKFSNPTNGYDGDQKQAARDLTVDAVYTVKRLDVGVWYTSVELEEVGGRFNSVLFTNESESTND